MISLETFHQLSDKTKLILVGCLGVAIASIPTSIALIVINLGSLSYKTEDTEINLSGKTKEAVNNTKYSTKELSNKLIGLQSDISWLVYYAENQPELLPQQVEKTQATFNSLIPTANQAIQDTEQLVESTKAIATEDNI